MRRLLVLIISLLLISSSLSSATANKPRAGASCKMVGSVVISKNKEFTCLKKGKKKVWSKGVVIKVAPTLSPTPTPTPTPTITISPTPTPIPSLTPTSSPTLSPTPTPTSTSTPTPTPTVRGYTRADVAQRNSPSDCWTIVDGNVYDLTRWIGAHPGGPGVIRGLCGVEGTVTFKAQHGRSARANSILESYLLGPLKS